MTPCDQVHVYKGPCKRELGHKGPHRWTDPDATGPPVEPPADTVLNTEEK